MRFANLRLERYGPFDSLDLAFDPAPGRVNLVVAANGFGKSVIRRAFGEFLFGIEARTPMTFRFGTERMRIHADIVHDAANIALVRRKGNRNTLAYADGTEVLPDQERRLLGGADATVFQELFGLDTTLLRSGGRDLIRSQGRLGQVLFAAGGGLGRVRELLAELERKRDELGKASARHKSRPLWSALSNWEQGVADLRKVALRPDGWQALERQAADTAAQLETLLHQQAEDARERERLRIIGACRPWLDRLRSADQVLTEAQDAPELEEGFENRWRDALQRHVVCAGNAEAATLDLQAARDARSALTFDAAWIAAEADIVALGLVRGRAEGAETDLPEVRRTLAADQLRAAGLRRNLGWDAAQPLPPETVVKDAQRRLQLHPKLAQEAATAADRVSEAERSAAATMAELATLPDQNDLAVVADLAGLLRANGDPAVRLATERRKLREAEAALRAALAAIPDSPLPEAALGTTAAPSEARLEAAAKLLGDAEVACGQANRDLAAKSADIASENARLIALEQTASLPAPEALRTARDRRDALWAQFCALERPDHAAAVAMDRALRDADDVADALIRHGREVAEAAGLRARLDVLQGDRAVCADAVTRAAGDVSAARHTLLTIAQAAGANTDDVTSLRAFLRARAVALSCRDTRDALAAELAATEAVLSQLGNRLAAALDFPARDLAELGALLAEADRRIEADRALAARRNTLVDHLAKQRVACSSAAAIATKVGRTLAEWDEGWDSIAGGLARPPGEAPAATANALGEIEALRAAERAIDDAARRITDMNNAIALLTERVSQLAVLSPAFAALPPIKAAEAFQRRLQAEQNAAVRCADADLRIRQAETKCATAVAEAETAARALAGLRAALRAETNDQAEHQLQRARAVASARVDHAQALRELAVQGGGSGVPSLAARAGETSAEADMLRIAAIDAGQQDRAKLVDAAREASSAAAAALARAGEGQDAAEAAARREAAQAMLARTAEEALVLHATHALLEAALERQAAGADQPLLMRIGDVFKTITGGVQAGVRVEDTRDGQTMVALEADGLTRKSLDHLSEGTCDQLFLALRIAALEDYAAKASPLPFIADDILQTFDDPRTVATLQALAELSQRVQVIVLTHHPHVGELARRLPAGVVRVLELSESFAA